MKITKYLALALMVIGIAGVAPAANAATASTASFVQKATVINGFEIMAGRMALERSRNPEVRDFARMMVDAHDRADDNLRDALRNSGYRMRSMPNDLDRAHQAKLQRLSRSQGPDFDRQYVQYMRQGHDEAVNLYASYARNGGNRSIREYARETLPDIREHREHAREIRLYR